jgi:hypothetical protein
MQQAMLTDVLGYVAAGLVFATFCAQQMALLRALAIASNVAFIGYGFLDSLWPILILHSAMLPINIQRYRQSVREHCGTTTVDARTPVPSSLTLLRNLITTALGRLRPGGGEGFRRQRSSMFADDFGDFKVPPSLVADVLRRRPSRSRDRSGVPPRQSELSCRLGGRSRRPSPAKILSQCELGHVPATGAKIAIRLSET